MDDVMTKEGTMHSVTLYHTEWCPECVLVRSLLDELEIEYKSVIVPTVRPFRKQVFEISGQYYVPVLVDGDTVLTETPDILDHLDALASTQSGATPEGQHPVEDPVNESLS
jgi:glutathione S-transferase